MKDRRRRKEEEGKDRMRNGSWVNRFEQSIK